MKDTIEFIEKNLTKEKLEAIASALITAYRSEDDLTLKTYAAAAKVDYASGQTGRKKLFYGIISRLHPDRLPVLTDDFTKAKAASDIESLSRLKQLLELKEKAAVIKSERFDYQHTETWAAEDDEDPADFYDDYSDVRDGDVESSDFINAVKSAIFGNHDFYVEPADLGQIDGGLDVANCGLDDLEGLEYCRNVRSLDISMNDISNIYDLSSLSQLEELYASGNSIRDIDVLAELDYLEIADLSDNDIEDIKPLLKMQSLKFADLRKNPVSDRATIKKLETMGVIVLFS